MTALSIVSIVTLAILIILFALALKKQSGRIGLRCACACGQLVIVMTATLFFFLMAQNSVIYDNAANGLFDAEKIDLFYMSKAAGIVCLIAAVWAALCFAGSLVKQKRVIVFALGVLAVIGGLILALWLLTKHCPPTYYATMVPAVMIEGWCLLALTVNALIDDQKVWRRLTVAAINLLNGFATIGTVIYLAMIANDVAQSIEIQNVMVLLFAIILIVVAMPGLINGGLAVADAVKIIKSRKRKA